MNQTSRKRKLLVLMVIIIVGVSATFAAVGLRPKGVQARIEVVEQRDLIASVIASGWIRATRAVDVQSDIMGRITELAIEEGDHVEPGQFLLRIDPTQYEAAVSRARAAVSEALAREAQSRANLLQARRALERLESMFQSDIVSQEALAETQTQVMVQEALHEAALHGVDQARAALSEAEDQLAKSVIRAPIAGVVTRLNVELGETAIVGTTNNPGSLLLTISDLSVMEAVVRIDETDVPYISIGDSASVTIDAFPRQEFPARVTKIGHSAVQPPGQAGAQAQAVDFEIVVTLDEPPPNLRPDLSANADIVTAVRDSALAIPIIALTVREIGEIQAVPHEQPQAAEVASSLASNQTDVEGVFVVRDGVARFVPVEVGIAGREHFEVLSGLAAGDSVVAGPYDVVRTLTDETAVRPQPQAIEATTQTSGAM